MADNEEYIPAKIEFLSFSEHVSSRSMWKGSSTVSDQYYWVMKEGKFTKEKITISEALLKCFDEILVNAIDQYINIVNCPLSMGGPVTQIKVGFDVETGMISVFNTGQGIPIFLVDKLNSWSVQNIITREYTGSNFDDKTEKSRVVGGGQNGLGIKLVNIDSTYFEVETVDVNTKRYYHQICKNGMKEIQPPTVIDLSESKNIGCMVESFSNLTLEQKKPHTLFRFIPNYSNLCKGCDWFGPDNLTAFQKLIEFRTYQAAAFISSINYRYVKYSRIEYPTKATVYFNNQLLKLRGMNDFLHLFGVTKSVYFKFEQSKQQVLNLIQNNESAILFPWYAAIGINPHLDLSIGPTTTKLAGFGSLSMLNGLYLKQGANYLDVLLGNIAFALQTKITNISKDIKPGMITEMLRKVLVIADCRQLPIPQFSSQTKSAIEVTASALTEMKKIFTLNSTQTNEIWELIREPLEYMIYLKDQASSKATRKKHIQIRKYTPATKLGKESWCFCPEGDSAAKPVRNIIHNRNSPLSYQHCGIYNLQGVPMNACKKVRKLFINDKLYLKRSKGLDRNVTLQGLVHILGLDYNKDYYYGPHLEDVATASMTELDKLFLRRTKGDADFAALPYGKGIVLATDQDVDGIGQICSLILVFFLVFWPDLVRRGYVKRLATPIIRVYHGSESYNFYSDKEFQDWVIANFSPLTNDETNGQNNDETNTNQVNADLFDRGIKLLSANKSYKVKYYKGLSTHTAEEVIHDIGANILSNIYTFTWSDATLISMEILYGQATESRKLALSSPHIDTYDVHLLDKQRISCDKHFLIEAKAFQQDFMKRKLKSAIDGLLPSQRKAIAGARLMTGQETKVYQLTGLVTKKMCYQHGDSSMNATIIKMAQSFTGSNNIPPFIGISDGFGDRVDGRGKTGSARYIDIKYNPIMDLLFPVEDNSLLNYVYEDGTKCEPTQYVPILPYAILETSTTAGAGWKIDCFARNFDDVLNYVRQLINEDESSAISVNDLYRLRAWIPKGMDIRNVHKDTTHHEICVGSYKFNESTNTVIVTQLPLKVWSHPYRCKLLGISPKTGKNTNQQDEPYTKKEYVKDCIDHTANDENRIFIKLTESAVLDIETKYGSEFISAFEDYFELSQSFLPHLNMFNYLGVIQEYNSYEEVIRAWYPIRKQMYQDRMYRQTQLLQAEIDLLTNTVRFIELDHQSKIIDFLPDEERIAILEKEDFIKINKSALERPATIAGKNIHHVIYDSDKANYDYIDNITVKMKSQANYEKLKSKLADCQSRLQELQSQSWKQVWLQEITKLEKMIKEGIKTNWLFGIKKHIFKKGKVTKVSHKD